MMAKFSALISSIVLSFAVSALAGPVARESFITYPISKKASKSIAVTIAKDQARLAKYNSAGLSSATVINEDNSYIAQVTVGTQIVSNHFCLHCSTN